MTRPAAAPPRLLALLCCTGLATVAGAAERPSISVSQPLTAAQRRDPGISEAEMKVIERRAADEGLCALGLRFSGDPLVPAERFKTLKDRLGDAFEVIEIDSSPGNPCRGSPSISRRPGPPWSTSRSNPSPPGSPARNGNRSPTAPTPRRSSPFPVSSSMATSTSPASPSAPDPTSPTSPGFPPRKSADSTQPEPSHVEIGRAHV